MGGITGGKGGKQQAMPMMSPQPAPQPAPIIAPREDPYAQEKLKEDKARAAKALLAMRGRQATILTDEQSLGDVNSRQRKLLGGT